MMDSVITRQQTSMGYTTCFWGTINYAVPIFDREGWFASLQTKTRVSSPEKFREAIMTKNHTVLLSVIRFYYNPINKGIQRDDLTSVNQRIAALVASFFDILFAYNRIPLPGEKRLIEIAKHECAVLPLYMDSEIKTILLCQQYRAFF
jgi:hypothetical protein